MNKDLLVASVLALAVAAPIAYAGTSSGSAVYSTTPKSSNVINRIQERKHRSDDTIEAYVLGEQSASAQPVTIRYDRTAEGLIGEAVLNPAGDKIATVKDIILQGGHASLIILSDGGLLGIGNKLAAFDYGKVVTQQNDGKVVMALTQGMIDTAADFSYDPQDQATANIIPAGSVSVNDILDGHLLDNRGKEVGDIDNISFANNNVEHVIVSFNKKLGMGGSLAALDYGSLTMIKKDNAVNFGMSEAMSKRFVNLQKTAQR